MREVEPFLPDRPRNDQAKLDVPELLGHSPLRVEPYPLDPNSVAAEECPLHGRREAPVRHQENKGDEG